MKEGISDILTTNLFAMQTWQCESIYADIAGIILPRARFLCGWLLYFALMGVSFGANTRGRDKRKSTHGRGAAPFHHTCRHCPCARVCGRGRGHFRGCSLFVCDIIVFTAKINDCRGMQSMEWRNHHARSDNRIPFNPMRIPLLSACHTRISRESKHRNTDTRKKLRNVAGILTHGPPRGRGSVNGHHARVNGTFPCCIVAKPAKGSDHPHF
jgi:hypothetical protein